MSKTEIGTGDSPETPRSDIAHFAIKTCIVAAAISVCTLFVSTWIIESIEDSTSRTIDQIRAQLLPRGPIGGSQFWAKIEKGLDDAAEPDNITPERKRKLLNDVHVIVAQWRPFIDAIRDEMQKPPEKSN
jgi:hypothetical protein